MKFKDYVREVNQSLRQERGKTTTDKGHRHDYFIERGSGDGSTGVAKGHSHKIKAMVVLKAPDGHDHSLDTAD